MVCAGVAAVTVAGCGVLPGSAEPESSPTLGPPPGGSPSPMRLTCPPQTEPPAPGEGVTGGPGPIVPGGAVSARLCLQPDAPGWRYRGRMLGRDVVRVVNALNGLPAYDPPVRCTKEGGPLFLLVLGYPAGQRVVVRIQNVGCQMVQVDERVRLGGRRVINVYASLVDKYGAPTPS